MSNKGRFVLSMLLLLWVIGIVAVLAYGNNLGVLSPRGVIADKERHLMITATLLSLIVVVPVLVLTFVIAWKYRAGNKKATYVPEWDGDRRIEAIWWGVPLVLIGVLSVMIWTSSHDLDPATPLVSDRRPLTIEVIALRWKWLFIYPEQDIATVNYVQFPRDTPINFHITADAPMNSFWIPQLGGQIYAMEGMSTQLHLMADQSGEFRGSSANISGRGFAGMDFTAQASTQADFELWVNQAVKRSDKRLDARAYAALAKPSENHRPSYYASTERGLYDRVMMKFMPRGATGHGGH